MKDHNVYIEHNTEKIVIYEADVDIEIAPLVRWLNSLRGIMTRWSCEGDVIQKYKRTYAPPYITIWVEICPEGIVMGPSEHYNDFDMVKSTLGEYAEFDADCTEGQIHIYTIRFNSKNDMKRVQELLTAPAASE